jgi:hypothetical protein
MALQGLRLADMSDREVLLVVHDLEDNDGWVLAFDVGMRLGIVEEHAKRAAAQRMTWLRRYGALEREVKTDHKGDIIYDPKGNPRWGQRWRLTEVGRVIALGTLRRTHVNALDTIHDGQLLLITRGIADRIRGAENFTAAKLAEREWRHRLMRQNGTP